MKKLIGLPALLAVMAVFAVPAPTAGASVTEEQHCYAYSRMCAWAGGEWNGQLSWWPSSSTGCHNHADNPNLRSFLNKTPYTVRIGGWGNLGPGYGLQMPNGQSITGELCWPV